MRGQATPGRQANRSISLAVWVAFILCALTALALFFVPAFIIRPFRYQSPRALSLGLALRQQAPLSTLIAALACVVLTFYFWQNASRWGKALLTLTVLAVAFSAVMVRMNYFEWMFHPVDSPKFLAPSESKLDPNEMIMAVRMGSDARAYPISQMAYHHILNDVVGGVPVAVTY